MKKLFKSILPILFLLGCQKGTGIQPTTTLETLATFSQTPELASATVTLPAETLTPSPTATPDSRLPPEQWQEWPIVPTVTGRAIEIYRQGQTLGNNPHAFSKVGDCQSVKAAFMGFLDDPQRIPNTPEYQALQETIDQFAGYFNTDGQAVKGGFTAATVLSPLWSNPDVCLAGENPLECELRVTKPIIVFIGFEVWWEGRTAEQYEKYMRQIIETVIDRGAVPILATKADNVEGNHSINLTTAHLAHEYDLPLFNFWLAVQPLPYHGMDMERDDGFHISYEAWNTHSFTGLQTLDSIWRGLRDVSASGSASPTSTVVPVEDQGLLPIPDSGPALSGSGEQIVFGTAKREGTGYQPLGVTLFDLDSETGAQLLGSGWDFQAASTDGQTLLVNLGSSLYRTDGLTLTLVSSDFYAYGNTGALSLEDGSIVLIIKQGTGTALAHAQADGSGLTTLTQPGEAPIELYPSTDGINLTWESGSCSAYRVCDRQGAWLTNLQTGQSRSLTGMGRPLVSPDGAAMAYEYPSGDNRTNLAFATADGFPTGPFQLYGDILADLSWEPGGGWLAVHLAVRSSTSGQVLDGVNYLVNPLTLETRQLSSVLLSNPRLLWSPDGGWLAWLGTDWLTDRYSIRLFQVEVGSAEVTNLTPKLGMGDTDYIFVTNGAWLTKP